MILAKVPNFTPECLWIVGSVYVGHSGPPPTTVAERQFASIRQALDRVVPFDNNHPVIIFGDWNTDPQRLQRIVHSWGHGLTVMQFSGSQITSSAQSMVDGIRQSTTLCVMHQHAHFLPRHVWTDRQQWPTTLSFAHPFEQRLKDKPPVPRAPTISRHHCLEATDRIATSNYWDVLADVAADDT
ncbi:hypothetical protein BASA83_012320 [Batrachochytrium salamandrivorans]|nr:hypothetical protein BASA83_012320 [Batrachochytrium salamandrivorans]